ncbi:MAG: peptidoglycan DD-metalloendopeptidase family protein [Candidatus Syntrophosphaera sp.]|nr:peptidoglycan DD-metalloendopeptidase family protein [Candidatus Syntrophosphaera sp.]
MRKIMIMLALALALAMLFGDELSDKQRQLDKLQEDLKNALNKAAQTEAQKKRTESEIQSTQKVKSQTDRELRESREEARLRLNTLNTVKTELRSVEERIRDLNGLQNSQLDKLVRVERKLGTTKVSHKDQHLLALMASQTREKLDGLGDVQVSLVAEQNQKGREYSLANTKVQKTYSTSRNLGNKVKNLESQKTKLTKEQQKLQTQIAKLQKDAAQLESLIAQIIAQSGKEPASYKFSAKTIAWPLRGRIIRSFGEETRSYGTSVVCNGIDIAAPEWTTVVAADAGEVVFSGSYGGQGKLVIIDHKNGFFTVYAYNNELLVANGATVSKGQAIAKSGMTGSATVPSLHFEVRKDGRAVNPLSYLE